MLAYIVFVIGVIAGMVSVAIIYNTQFAGVLRIDTSDPEDGAYMFLELAKPPHAIRDGRLVVMRVSVKDYIPHE